MPKITHCHTCNRITTGEMVWPDPEGNDICQECWEKACSVEWWKMIEQLDNAGLLEDPPDNQ